MTKCLWVISTRVNLEQYIYLRPTGKIYTYILHFNHTYTIAHMHIHVSSVLKHFSLWHFILKPWYLQLVCGCKRHWTFYDQAWPTLYSRSINFNTRLISFLINNDFQIFFSIFRTKWKAPASFNTLLCCFLCMVCFCCMLCYYYTVSAKSEKQCRLSSGGEWRKSTKGNTWKDKTVVCKYLYPVIQMCVCCKPWW